MGGVESVVSVEVSLVAVDVGVLVSVVSVIGEVSVVSSGSGAGVVLGLRVEAVARLVVLLVGRVVVVGVVGCQVLLVVAKLSPHTQSAGIGSVSPPSTGIFSSTGASTTTSSSKAPLVSTICTSKTLTGKRNRTYNL